MTQIKKHIAKVFENITLQNEHTQHMYIATYLTTMLLLGLAVLVALIHKVITKELIFISVCSWVVGAIVVAILFKQMFKIYVEVHTSAIRKTNAENESNAKFFMCQRVENSDELLACSFSSIQGLTYIWICFITGVLIAVISMVINTLIHRLAIHYENFLKVAPKIKQ